MAKKSETLSQRNKAQHDLIELKKMQAGEIPTGKKPSDDAIEPKTVKEKTENFFYHYKYIVMLAIFLVVVGVVLTVNLVTRVNYDSKVVVFSYDMGYSFYNERIADYFETLYSDVNENGKVDVAAVDCSVSNKQYDDFSTAKLTKMNSILAVDDDTLIFLFDKESIKRFTENESVDVFREEDMIPLPKEFYDFIGVDNLSVPETELYAVMRKTYNTTIQGKNEKAINAALEVIEKLRGKEGALE